MGERGGGGFWWTRWGRVLAWFTLRGRVWSLVALAAVGVMIAGRVAMERWWAPAGGLSTTYSSHGFTVWWDVSAQRGLGASEAREARREGREVLALQVNVVMATGPAMALGELVGVHARVWHEARGEGAERVDEEALRREIRWGDRVDQAIAGSGQSGLGALRRAAAGGPASVIAWRRDWAARAAASWALTIGIAVGVAWLVVAVMAEALRGSASAALRARGLCWKCGYALGVEGAERCPECGAVVGGYAARG